MSLKGIELQIAIPKTFDAGKIAEQKQQQSQLNQDHANALTGTANDEKRGRLSWKRKSMRKRMQMRNNVNKDELTDREQQRNNEEEKKTMHPYKGAFVDFTG